MARGFIPIKRVSPHMDVENLYSRLKDAPIDPQTGIRIVRITGDDAIALYAAEIEPQTSLNPHYHRRGIEIYQILEGSGLMRTGTRSGGDTKWEEEYMVRAGDCFPVRESVIHQLANPKKERLLAVFIAPPSHLEEDRFFISS